MRSRFGAVGGVMYIGLVRKVRRDKKLDAN
jgi:hypothetical protein